jgi:hypothetical protein
MKNWPLFLCIGLFVLSCKKSGSSNNVVTSSSDYLSSVTNSSPRTKLVDSFTYDNSHRLAGLAQYAYDTSSGSPVFNSWKVSFTLPADGSAPAAYTYSDNQGNNDPHQLYYDGQGRISKDTSVSGSGFVIYFSYPGSDIAIKVLFDGTPLNNQIDTLFLNNGNVGSEHIYFPNNAGTADSLEGNLQFGYGTDPNPAYHSGQLANVSPLLHILQFDGYGSFMDPISQRALNSAAGAGDGLPVSTTVNYNQTNDSKGRLSQMTANVGGFGNSTILFAYY